MSKPIHKYPNLGHDSYSNSSSSCWHKCFQSQCWKNRDRDKLPPKQSISPISEPYFGYFPTAEVKPPSYVKPQGYYPKQYSGARKLLNSIMSLGKKKKTTKKTMEQYCTHLALEGQLRISPVPPQNTCTLSDIFRSGNIVQLVSRSSEGTVQIVDAGKGEDVQLVIDAKGPLDPSALNTLWLVTELDRESSYTNVQLSNCGNYMGVFMWRLTLLATAQGQMPPDKGLTAFEVRHVARELSETSNLQLNYLDCVKLQHCAAYLGFSVLGDAFTTKWDTNIQDTQFGVKIVHRGGVTEKSNSNPIIR